jgi:hypothetical protein
VTRQHASHAHGGGLRFRRRVHGAAGGGGRLAVGCLAGGSCLLGAGRGGGRRVLPRLDVHPQAVGSVDGGACSATHTQRGRVTAQSPRRSPALVRRMAPHESGCCSAQSRLLLALGWQPQAGVGQPHKGVPLSSDPGPHSSSSRPLTCGHAHLRLVHVREFVSPHNHGQRHHRLEQRKLVADAPAGGPRRRDQLLLVRAPCPPAWPQVPSSRSPALHAGPLAPPPPLAQLAAPQSLACTAAVPLSLTCACRHRMAGT